MFSAMREIPEDERKFNEIYKKYRYLMMTVAMNVLEDYHLAEDVVQSAFVSLYKNRAHVGESDSIATKRYLVTITKNAAIDMYRKRERKMQKEIYIDELGGENVPLTYIETDLDNAVLDILKNLPVKYRDIFLLKYSSRMDNAEIARLYHIQEGTVRQRIARGKVLIQNAIKNLEEA